MRLTDAHRQRPIGGAWTATIVTTTKTVIVADDTAFVRDRFATALLGAGHTALTVKSAAELLASIRADLDRIDLIVLDLRLPHAGGVALVRSIRKLDDGRLPILVFSGTIATAEEVRELAALGVAGYVNEYSAVQHILPSLAPHLFPDNFNRRGSPRVVLGIPVAYRFGNTIAAALTLNISKGGVAIRTMSPLQGGAKIRARFRLPGSKRDIEAESRVAWSDRRVGMGLQFEKVDPTTRARSTNSSISTSSRTGRRESAAAGDAFAYCPEQPQRIRNDDERCAHVGGDRHPERGRARDRHHEKHQLQCDREGDVRADVLRRRAAEPQGVGDLQQLVGHQRDVGGLERGIGACHPHRHAHVGRGQGGRVVDAVADHHDGAVARAQRLDAGHLVFRKQIGAVFVDVEPRRASARAAGS